MDEKKKVLYILVALISSIIISIVINEKFLLIKSKILCAV